MIDWRGLRRSVCEMYARAKMQEFVALMSDLSAVARRAKAEATCGISGPGYRCAHAGYGAATTSAVILRCETCGA
ncbi:hypothetical protein CO683_13630 [Bradyrhizobium ottawaense]|nr:hypothetical protein [Bradyrhizobium sp. CCBAU 25360]PDT69030.1 hypothetical protein CO683_13630 [Bradyrhizobium ottawaense]